MSWKNWGDHPIVISIGVVSTIAGLAYTIHATHFAKSSEPVAKEIPTQVTSEKLRLNVRDLLSKEPVSGVTVEFSPSNGSSSSKQTGSDGYVDIEIPKNTSIKIYIRHPLYYSEDYSVNLQNDSDKAKDIFIKKIKPGEGNKSQLEPPLIDSSIPSSSKSVAVTPQSLTVIEKTKTDVSQDIVPQKALPKAEESVSPSQNRNKPGGATGYSCGELAGVPSVIATTSKGAQVAMLRFQSANTSENGLTPRNHCLDVAQRFDSLNKQGRLRLSYFTWEEQDGHNVICIANNMGGPCASDGILITLRSGRDPNKFLSDLSEWAKFQTGPLSI